jgi:hypothetical protein
VDLVRDDDEIVPQDQLAQGQELAASHSSAGWVVGVDEEEDFGLRGQVGGRAHIERPSRPVVDDRRGQEATPHAFDGVGERGIGGGKEQDAIAGRRGQVRHDLDYLDQVEENAQVARGGGPGVALRHAGRPLVFQDGGAVVTGVAEVPALS